MDIEVIFFGVFIFLVCCLILYRSIINLANGIAEQQAKRDLESPPLEPGLYIFPGSKNEIECVSKMPDVQSISRAIKETDWSGISSVMLVKGLNHSVEVSGSSNPYDGFAAIYKNQKIWASAKEPPKSINEMVEILCAFYQDESRALDKYEFG